jgi:hypothetical protein
VHVCYISFQWRRAEGQNEVKLKGEGKDEKCQGMV